MLGLVGAPGAGKTTVAEALCRQFADVAQVVAMDGFHLANDELVRLGRRQRKGAPDTYDVTGFLYLLRRLRRQAPDEIVYAPAYRREIKEPIAGASAILPQTRLLVVEGNYLLLEQAPWSGVAALLDEVWYVDVPDDVRVARLTRRHVLYGRSPQEAAAWVAGTDEPNARLIAGGRGRADLLFSWEPVTAPT